VPSRAGRSGTGRRGRIRRVGTAKLAAVAVAISAITMITMTASAVITGASCSDQPVLANIAVSADIAPAIQTVARAFNNQNFTADGRCAQVEITEGDSSAQAGQIDGQATVAGLPQIDAWIPDSSLWVNVVRSFPVGAENVQPTGKSVARSPLMMVTTPAVADETHVFDLQPGWDVLLPPSYGGPPASLGLSVDLPDPTDSSAGLATLVEISRDLGNGAAARVAFTKFVYSVEATEDFDSVSALQTFVQSTQAPLNRKAVTVASEQAVLAYDQANPAAPLAARYVSGGANPALGTPELDYPFVLTTGAPAALAAATQFGNYLQTSYAASAIRYDGFRSADGVPDQMPAKAGLTSQPLQLATAAGSSEAASNLQIWQRLGLGSKDLTLIDVSPAMNQPAGNGQTLLQELTATAADGLGLFPDSTHMGLWEIGRSRSTADPYSQLVSSGPLPADVGLLSRREQLQQIIETLSSGTGHLALNKSILDAFTTMTSTYAPNYANAVLVLTAGVDSSRGDISLASLLHQLRALYNPAKKVEIVIIMFGHQGNLAALQSIADATGGAAYEISNPQDVGKIFIEAIAHRICDQGCTAP
jgi:Ca-activated chloride channel family protein